mgnify:CR=1 FL=1
MVLDLFDKRCFQNLNLTNFYWNQESNAFLIDHQKLKISLLRFYFNPLLVVPGFYFHGSVVQQVIHFYLLQACPRFLKAVFKQTPGNVQSIRAMNRLL